MSGPRVRWEQIGAAIVIAAFTGCGSGGSPAPAPPTPVRCPAPPDSTGRARLATVFVDGRPIATNVMARLEREFPESYELEQPEPAAVAAIPAESIDLIQFARGAEVEREYQLCPGVVAFLITTKRPRAGSR